jgi:hypothetical protein
MAHANKLLVECGAILLVIAPLAFWSALYFADRRGHSFSPFILLMLRTLRWTFWILALALFLASWIHFHHYRVLVLAGAASTFSVGLSFPERWLKRRIPNPLDPLG